MPVKTRSRPKSRGVSYRPHRPAARRRPAARPSFKLPLGRSPLSPWLAVPVALGLGVSMIWLAPLIVDGFEALLELFGIGLALLAIAVVADARTALKRSLSIDRTFLRVWGGLHLML